METVVTLLDQSVFMPHGHCYLWEAELVWVHALSDGLIALAYFTIPLTLFYFVRKRRDLPFSWMFVAFGLFIVTCGGTHAFAVWNVWHSAYWLSGGVKALTAVVSLGTAALLVPLVPRALALPTPQAMAREVERRRRAEEEARAQRLEQAYARKLEGANRELERANRELEDFVLVASHDLQAPLRKVESFGEILEEEAGEALGETARDALDRMRSSSRRMSGLLDDLLRLSRISTQGEPFRSVDLSRTLAEVQDLLEVPIEEAEAEISLGALPTVPGDPSQLSHLFQNLVSNALKYRHPDRSLEIRVEAEKSADGEWEIVVRDNGIGFQEKYIDRIFKPFQRLHGPSEYEGTGMGLAICAKIVERHEGEIGAESIPGEGSTFRVRLPAGPNGESPESPESPESGEQSR